MRERHVVGAAAQGEPRGAQEAEPEPAADLEPGAPADLLTLSDPIVSILWGVLVFGERVRTGWFDVLAAVSALVLAAAVLVLIRSPLLSDESAPAEGDQPSAPQRTARS